MKTIMMLYIGTAPLVDEPNKGFSIAGLSIFDPLVAIDRDSQELQVSNEPAIARNVLRISGSVFITTGLAIGIMPGTSFVIWGLDDELVNPLKKGVEDFLIKELDYETFRKILVKASKNADVNAAIVGEKVELAYFHYFGIDISKMKPDDQIQLVAKSKRTVATRFRRSHVFDLRKKNALVDASHNYSGAFKFDRIVPANDLECVLTTAALIEDITKELKIYEYQITIFLHTIDEGGERCTAVIYEKAKNRETDEPSH